MSKQQALCTLSTYKLIMLPFPPALPFPSVIESHLASLEISVRQQRWWWRLNVVEFSGFSPRRRRRCVINLICYVTAGHNARFVNFPLNLICICCQREREQERECNFCCCRASLCAVNAVPFFINTKLSMLTDCHVTVLAD